MTTSRLPRPPHARAALQGALEIGPVVVSAPPGALPHELLRECWDAEILRVDAAAAGTLDGLGVDVVRRVVRNFAPEADIESTDPDGLVDVARAFPGRLGDAIAAATGTPPSDFTLDDAIAGIPGDALLVVESAHLLLERWAGRALWAMRGRAEDRELNVAFVVPTWAADKLLQREQAFFGFARHVPLKNRADAEAWSTSLRDTWDPAQIEWAVTRTQGQFESMREVLDQAHRHGVGLQQAADGLVADRVALIAPVLAAAQALTKLGGRILRAVALGYPPYPAVPNAASNRVASALRHLQRAGLVYSSGRADWQLSDPLLAAAFATRSPGDR